MAAERNVTGKAVACIAPADMREGELLSVLEGTATVRVSRHIARCAHCAQALERLAETDAELLAARYRLNCPETEQLLGLQAGLLPQWEVNAIRQHTQSCAECQETMQLLAISDPSSPLESITAALTDGFEAIVKTGKTIIATVMQSPSTPAMALRGETPRRRYQAGDYVLLLTLEKQGGQRLLLEGQLQFEPLYSRWDTIPPSNLEECAVLLLQNGRELTRDYLDEFGIFSLEYSGAGHVSLAIDLPDARIEVHELQA